MRPIVSLSSCCRSSISQTTPPKIISPMASPRSLTTDLSRLRGSFVIARNTAFTFKGKNVDAREIGKELGVRYVLEGSVQRDAGRMRVNVQLIDAETGNHIWADRFDKPAADLLQMQDEIVARLANQLGSELIAAEARRTQQAPNPDSMDLYFQGQAWLNKSVNPENMARARGYFERALALDPNNLDALLGVGRVDYSVGGAYLSDDREAQLAAGEVAIAKVLSQRPNDALAHEIMGGILNQTHRSEQGIAELERALALDPNLATAHGDIGLAKMFVGRPEETEAHEKEALRLSPRDSFAWLWLHFEGGAKMGLGANEEAVALFRRSIEINRTNPLAHFFLGRRWQIWASWKRRSPKPRPAWRSTRASRYGVFATETRTPRNSSNFIAQGRGAGGMNETCRLAAPVATDRELALLKRDGMSQSARAS